MPPKKSEKKRARRSRTAAAAAAPVVVVERSRRPRVPRETRERSLPSDLYSRALMCPFTDGVGMKYPDLSCRASATCWSLATAAVSTDATGASAFAFNPSDANLFTVAGTTASGVVNWGSASPPLNLSALTGSSSQYRCVSAGMLFIPSTSVTNATGLFTITQTTQLPTGAVAVANYANQANAVFVPISDTWQAFWKPLDFESVNYKPWGTAANTSSPDNNITYTIAGAPASTSIGRLVFLVNWEVIVDNGAGSILSPTPAICSMPMLQHSANHLGSMSFITNMSYMTGAGPSGDVASSTGDTVGGAATAGGWATRSLIGSSIVSMAGAAVAAHTWHMSRRARHLLSSMSNLRRYDD